MDFTGHKGINKFRYMGEDMDFLITNEIDKVDLEKLMDIYEESNWENLSMVESEKDKLSDKNILYQKVRENYKSYLKNEFLKDGKNFLAIFKDDKAYLAALMIYDEGDFYLLEALETRPDARRRGYGEELVKGLISCLGNDIEIRSEVSKSNQKSLALHKKLGFEIKEERKTNLLLSFKEN